MAPDQLEYFPKFKDHPDMFNSEEFKAHGHCVVDAVDFAVNNLYEDEVLIPMLQSLGYLHVKLNIFPP